MVGARRHVFQNAPKSAKEFYATIDPSDSGGASAHWRLDFASASATGDFGFTTEPFSGEDTAFGYCLTVLCKQPNPDWRWIYKGGLDTPDRTKRIAPLMSSSSPNRPSPSLNPASPPTPPPMRQRLSAGNSTRFPACLVSISRPPSGPKRSPLRSKPARM
ncbi:MAG: hypothetical protein ABL956_09620 [Hyphomonadaceae bacterium]